MQLSNKETPNSVRTKEQGLKNYLRKQRLAKMYRSGPVAVGSEVGSRLGPEPIWLYGTSLKRSRLGSALVWTLSPKHSPE